MFVSLSGAAKIGRKGLFIFASSAVLFVLLGIFSLSSAESPASEPKMDHPKIYHITVGPAEMKKIGPDMVKELGAFFDYADNAIKTKDLQALGRLYSDKYRDSVHTRAEVMTIWQRVFNDFDDLRMTHNLRFLTSLDNGDVVMLQCTGVLMGSPKGEKNLQALDHWKNMSHVLVKEGGGWKLRGSYGVEEKRFWFDKPMHPLF